MGEEPVDLRDVVLGAHLILTGYGHWLPNDPRGSWSVAVRKAELRELGLGHLGRKRVQPPREELKAFYREAEPLLEHPTIWFDAPTREVIGEAIGEVVRERGYTVWACAVLRNHVHLVVRTHRDKAVEMLARIEGATRDAVIERGMVPEGHPVWSDAPYKVFLKTVEGVYGRIEYVEKNPGKERLPRQQWDFVDPCTLR